MNTKLQVTFGGVKLTRNADSDKNYSSGYNNAFDACGSF